VPTHRLAALAAKFKQDNNQQQHRSKDQKLLSLEWNTTTKINIRQNDEETERFFISKENVQ
jgi:hypothetical protein